MKPFVRSILPAIMLLFLATNSKGQFVQMTHFAGPMAYGGVTVTVTPGGGCTTTGGGLCFGPPLEYWIGNWCGLPAWYDYTFSQPVFRIKARPWGINGGPLGAGEYVRIYINGSPYALQPADVVSYTDCSPSGGPMYLNAGDFMGPVGTVSNYNGGTFIVTECDGITSCRMYTDGSYGGSAYWIWFDPTRPPTCVHAINNSPCIGDTLKLDLVGDSTGATYSWTGPGGFTSTLQNPWKYPATFADSGWYYVIRVAGPVHDTDSTHVVIHPRPSVNLTNNAPLCLGLIDTLQLFTSPGGVGDTYFWHGPAGFTSTVQDPTRPGYMSADTGYYTLVETTPFGCKDSAKIFAGIVPPPPAPQIHGDTAYCYGYTFNPFVVTGVTGIVYWYPSSTSTTPSLIQPTINTLSPGTYTVYATQRIGSCESPMDSFTVKVYPQVIPNFTYQIHRGCTSDDVLFTNTSTGAHTYEWVFGDESLHNFNADPGSHTYMHQDTFSVTLIARNEHPCEQRFTQVVDTRHSVKALYDLLPDTICVDNSANPLNFTHINNTSSATVYLAPNVPSPGQIDVYAWSFGDGTTDATNAPSDHHYNKSGIYTTKLVVTDSIGCKDSLSKNIYVLRVDIKSVHDTTLCLVQPLPLNNLISVNPIITTAANQWIYNWKQNMDNLDDSTIKVPFVSGFGDFVDTLTATIMPWGCYERDTITIHSIMGAKLQNVTASVTIHYGNSIQLNASNEVFYYWKPNDGSLNNNNINNPIASPTQNTIYTVYGYDKNGCLDSATVDVRLDFQGDGIPSAFTPNGDGINDIFRPVLNFQKLVEFSVFNRWGQEIFRTSDKTQGWDGTFHGTPQDMGVYYYMIIVAQPQGDNVIYKGEVTLIR